MNLARKCRTDEPFALISYSHRDEDKVRGIANALIAEGCNIWIDANELAKGMNWERVALRMIGNPQCKAILFFRSSHSVLSDNIRKEIEEANVMREVRSEDDPIHIHVVDIEVSPEEIQNMYLRLRKETYELTLSPDPKVRARGEQQMDTIRFFQRYFDENVLSFNMFREEERQQLLHELASYGVRKQASGQEAVSSGALRAVAEAGVAAVDERADRSAPAGDADQAVRAATQANDDAADGVARGLADEATAEGQADGDGAAGAAEGVTDEAAAVDLADEAESSSQTDGSGAHEPAARARTRSAGLSIRSIRVLDKKYAVKNQVQAFTLACELLLKRHPERVSDVVSRHTYLSGELEAKSTFKQHARLTIHGETVYVGTNLNFEQKLQAVATLCKLLGLSESAVGFVDDRQQEHRYEGGRHVQLPADPASGMDELPDEDPVESSSDTMVAAAAETAMEDREPRSEAKEVSSSTGQDELTDSAKRRRAAATRIQRVRIGSEIYDVANQNAAMARVYDVLLNRHPDRLDEVMSKQACVSGQLRETATFLQHELLQVGDRQVYVGTHASLKQKLDNIARLCEILGIPGETVAFIDADGAEYHPTHR